MAVALLFLGLGACDLPGSHSGDAAVVNDHVIPRSKWDHLVQVTTQQLKARVPVDSNSDAGRAQAKNLQKQSLRALVREQLIEDLARQHHVTVSSAELDAQVAQLAASLGGQGALNQRLDQAGETVDDVRHTIRINLLQQKLRSSSPTYQADYERALKDARVTAYVPPCDSDHSWPACAGGER